MNNVKPNHNLLIVALVSIAAVLGSLYYENFGDPVNNILSLHQIFPADNGLIPCIMCWWQRIFMYPIAAISLVAIIFKDKNWARFTLTLAIIGILFSIYHYIIQLNPAISTINCSATAPCTEKQVEYLGFITIPLLTAAAFGTVILASWNQLKKQATK